MVRLVGGGVFVGFCSVVYFEDVGQATLVYIPRRSLCREELAAKLRLADALGYTWELSHLSVKLRGHGIF